MGICAPMRYTTSITSVKKIRFLKSGILKMFTTTLGIIHITTLNIGLLSYGKDADNRLAARFLYFFNRLLRKGIGRHFSRFGHFAVPQHFYEPIGMRDGALFLHDLGS